MVTLLSDEEDIPQRRPLPRIAPATGAASGRAGRASSSVRSRQSDDKQTEAISVMVSSKNSNDEMRVSLERERLSMDREKMEMEIWTKKREAAMSSLQFMSDMRKRHPNDENLQLMFRECLQEFDKIRKSAPS